MRGHRYALLVLALTFGCSIGPGYYRRAMDARGAAVSIEMAGGGERVPSGTELLETTPEGLLLLTPGGEFIFVRYEAMRGAEIPQFPDLDLPAGQPPIAGDLALMRRISRFPQGTTPELRSRLLAAYGKTDIETRER